MLVYRFGSFYLLRMRIYKAKMGSLFMNERRKLRSSAEKSWSLESMVRMRPMVEEVFKSIFLMNFQISLIKLSCFLHNLTYFYTS